MATPNLGSQQQIDKKLCPHCGGDLSEIGAFGLPVSRIKSIYRDVAGGKIKRHGNTVPVAFARELEKEAGLVKASAAEASS